MRTKSLPLTNDDMRDNKANTFHSKRHNLIINKQYPFTKVGVNEVVGLKELMLNLMKPVQENIKDRMYWSDVALNEAEYVSRDGFIPHSDNCGGIEISEIIPSIERYEFDFLEYGECDECPKIEQPTHGESIQCGYEGKECCSETEGHLDAKLRVWFKFEGIDDNGVMNFWLYLGGGNGDAPYFRTQYEQDIFQVSFQAKSLKDLKMKAPKHIKALIKAMK